MQSVSVQLDPPPEFIKQRDEIWNRLKKEYDEFVLNQKPVPIKVTLPDGKVVDGESWRTTPYDVAKGIRYTQAKNQHSMLPIMMRNICDISTTGI